MSGYRKRLEQDLERWIAAGLVTPENRAAILATVQGGGARLSAAAALGISGSILLGLAVVTLVMANWDGIPRLARLLILLALLWVGVGGAAWAGEKRPRIAEGLVVFAGLVFAASVGLVGQMYNLPGDPWQALALAATGAFALSAAAGTVSGFYLGGALGLWAYFSAPNMSLEQFSPFDLLLLGVLACVTFGARRHRSAPLFHIAILIAIYAASLFILRVVELTLIDQESARFGFAALLAFFAAAGLAYFGWKREPRPGARTALGYGIWWAMGSFFGMASFAYDGDLNQAGLLLHNALAIALNVWIVSFGRAQERGWITAAGIVGAVIAVLSMLFAIGLDLMAIAATFCLLAVLAIGGAFALARKRKEGAGA